MKKKQELDTTGLHVWKNEHGAFNVRYKGVRLCANNYKRDAAKLCGILSLDPEIQWLASVLPPDTKVWHGAAGGVINNAHGRESSDYQGVCQELWEKVKAARITATQPEKAPPPKKKKKRGQT